MAISGKDSETMIVSSDSVSPKMVQTSLKSNLNQLLLEALKFVCCGMGLSETGQKQEIVTRLLKEIRGQTSLKVLTDEVEASGKEKE
ncbi:23305_t:CDS:1, partial [Cetraspora pellucida]